MMDSAVAETVLAGARHSDLHGDEHRRCVAASGLDPARELSRSDAALVSRP